MNARDDKRETAIARPVQGASALSEVERIDWSQQDPRTMVQKVRVLEALLLGYLRVIAAKHDKTAKMILKANPAFADGFDAVIDGFKQAFAEVRGSRQHLRDEMSVQTCAQEVIAEITHVLTEAERLWPDEEETWLRQERMVLSVRCLCMGFHGMLHAVECLTRAEATYDDDFRRGVLRGLALLGLQPHDIERILPHLEDLGFHLHCFENYVTGLIVSY